MERQPAPPVTTGGFRLSPKLIIFLVLLIMAVIFAAQNSQRVDLTLLFWEFRMRLVWALLLFGLIGAILGWMVPFLWRGRRR